jgi:hypothetical protein
LPLLLLLLPLLLLVPLLASCLVHDRILHV